MQLHKVVRIYVFSFFADSLSSLFVPQAIGFLATVLHTHSGGLKLSTLAIKGHVRVHMSLGAVY